MNKYFSGAYAFQIHLSATDSRVSLPDIPMLRDKRIKHLDYCCDDIISLTPDGKTILTDVHGVDDVFFTFREKNTQRDLIVDLPASRLNPALNHGSRLFINKIIDFQNSYVDVSKVLAANKDDVYIYMVAYFDYPEMWGLVRENNRTAILPLELTLTGAKTYFDENKELFRKSIQNIIASLPTITPNGKAGVQGVDNKFITLSYNNIEFISKLPISLLMQRQYDFGMRFQNVKFDPQSSYIETATTGVNDLKTVFFNVICDDNKN